MFQQIVKIARNFMAINVNSLSTVIQKQWLRNHNYQDYNSVPQNLKQDLNKFIQYKKKSIKEDVDNQVSNQMYKNWIYKILMSGKQKLEDLSKLINEIKRLCSFVKHLQYINNKLKQLGQKTIKKSQVDIKYFSSYGQLHNFLSKYSAWIQQGEYKSEAKQTNPSDIFPLVAKIGKYSLYTISQEQKKDFQKLYGEYGYDTGWCVAQGTVPFDYYLGNISYYYLVTIQKQPFALLSLDDFQFKDVRDDEIKIYNDDLINLVDYVFQKQKIDYDEQFDQSDFNDLIYYFCYKEFKYNDFKQEHNRFLLQKNGYKLYQNLMIQDYYVIVNKYNQVLNTTNGSFSGLTIFKEDFNQDMFDLYSEYIFKYISSNYVLQFIVNFIKYCKNYNIDSSKEQNKAIDYFITSNQTDTSDIEYIVYMKDNHITSQLKKKLIIYLVKNKCNYQLDKIYNLSEDQQQKDILLNFYIPKHVALDMLQKIKAEKKNKSNIDFCIKSLKEKYCNQIQLFSYNLLAYADCIDDQDIKYLVENCSSSYMDRYNIESLFSRIQSNHKKQVLLDCLISQDVHTVAFLFDKLNDSQQQNVIQMLVKVIKHNTLTQTGLIMDVIHLITKFQDIKQIVNVLTFDNYPSLISAITKTFNKQNSIFNLLLLQKAVGEGWGKLTVDIKTKQIYTKITNCNI